MKNMEINTNRVQIPNQDLLIDAYLVQPEGEGNFSAIIVFQ